MPGMSSLRRAAVVALAAGAALTWASADDVVAVEALIDDEACAADDEACSLSLRQLRGEQKMAEAAVHAFRAPEGGVQAAEPAESSAEKEGAAAKDAEEPVVAAEPAESSADKEGAAAKDVEEPAAAAEPAESSAEEEGAAAKDAEEPAKEAAETTKAVAAKPSATADKEDDEEDDADEANEDDDKAGSKDTDDDDEEDEKDDDEDEDGWDDEDEDEEETAYGEFCCQFGQGKGATDLSDVGASCYPSAKPERYDFCDDKSACGGRCNGTWVTGFCALEATGGPTAKDACATKLNGYATGYDYVGSLSRAVGNASCATASACGGCNGTWCHYVKTPIY